MWALVGQEGSVLLTDARECVPQPEGLMLIPTADAQLLSDFIGARR